MLADVSCNLDHFILVPCDGSLNMMCAFEP